MAASCLAKQGRPLLLTARLRYSKLMLERFWIPIQTIAADGGARPNSGGTPFRQPCPAYPSTIGRKAAQERFSEEKFPNRYYHSETRFSKAPLQVRAHTRTNSRSTQQAWIYSRNQTTIASACKHRQPVFLHPSNGPTQVESARLFPEGNGRFQSWF